MAFGVLHSVWRFCSAGSPLPKALWYHVFRLGLCVFCPVCHAIIVNMSCFEGIRSPLFARQMNCDDCLHSFKAVFTYTPGVWRFACAGCTVWFEWQLFSACYSEVLWYAVLGRCIRVGFPILDSFYGGRGAWFLLNHFAVNDTWREAGSPCMAHDSGGPEALRLKLLGTWENISLEKYEDVSSKGQAIGHLLPRMELGRCVRLVVRIASLMTLFF